MSLRARWNTFWLATDYYVAMLIWDAPDITISSQTAKARREGKLWGCIGCKFLNWMFHVEDHCAGALTHDAERAEHAKEEVDHG